MRREREGNNSAPESANKKLVFYILEYVREEFWHEGEGRERENLITILV